MDLLLDAADAHFLTPYVYPACIPEDNLFRQALSLYAIVTVGGLAAYLGAAALSYIFLFEHQLKKHPLYLKNQVRREITYSCSSIPWMILLTVPLFLLEVRGYSKLYSGVDGVWGWISIGTSFVVFLMFTDCLIYWIHWALHSRILYKTLHKGHHTWKVPTPFASHAFHPIDGWLQSLPYHIYPFLFPLHKVLYLFFFVFVNFWTVSIHDANYNVPDFLKPIVNGSAHHTDHHLYYMYNYGQFFTLWDRIVGSFREPSAFQDKGPLVAMKKDTEELKKQIQATKEKEKEE